MTQLQPAPVPPSGEPQAVAGVPRLFVGQIPTDRQEPDLLPVFAPYGAIEKLTLVRGPEGKSRGCAMVQYKRWADAERAAAGVNGTSPLEGGRGRPLVVHFANPRRLVGSAAAEPAITPRKLFVGQIPKTASEAEVAAVFAPYGEVQGVSILKSKGIHAGCAFVQLTTWAACEAAIEGLHEQRVMPGCEHALVVKFADAKRLDGMAGKARAQGLNLLGMLGHPGMLANHSYITGAELGMGPPLPPQLGGMQGFPGLGGMPGLFQVGGGVNLGHLHTAPGPKLGALDGSSSESLLEAGDSAGLPPLDHGVGRGHLGLHPPHAAQHQQVPPAPGSMHSMHSSSSLISLQAMQSGLGLSGMGVLGGYDHLALQQFSGMMVGGPPPQLRPIKLGRGVADPAAYAHKLFIGQIPFEATEQDLWAIFSPVGDILELAILRSQGRSKGCAFLTYASQAQAATAVSAFNGRPVGANKKLVVKFADQKA
ncbi:CRB3 [Auxenochlorella protothecoides x Auxenochlorella symbiontica]